MSHSATAARVIESAAAPSRPKLGLATRSDPIACEDCGGAGEYTERVRGAPALLYPAKGPPNYDDRIGSRTNTNVSDRQNEKGLRSYGTLLPFPYHTLRLLHHQSSDPAVRKLAERLPNRFARSNPLGREETILFGRDHQRSSLNSNRGDGRKMLLLHQIRLIGRLPQLFQQMNGVRVGILDRGWVRTNRSRQGQDFVAFRDMAKIAFKLLDPALHRPDSPRFKMRRRIDGEIILDCLEKESCR